jgi:hypothetical protein
MQKSRLAFILSLIAAALALAAFLVRYFADGQTQWYLLAATVFLLALGFSARKGSGSPG